MPDGKVIAPTGPGDYGGSLIEGVVLMSIAIDGSIDVTTRTFSNRPFSCPRRNAVEVWPHPMM